MIFDTNIGALIWSVALRATHSHFLPLRVASHLQSQTLISRRDSSFRRIAAARIESDRIGSHLAPARPRRTAHELLGSASNLICSRECARRCSSSAPQELTLSVPSRTVPSRPPHPPERSPGRFCIVLLCEKSSTRRPLHTNAHIHSHTHIHALHKG